MITTQISSNSMIIAGSSLNLACTTQLCSAVDSLVTVTTNWTGPNVMFLPANPVPAVMMMNLTTYTSTITVSAAKSGQYTCWVGGMSGLLMLSVGKIIINASVSRMLSTYI